MTHMIIKFLGLFCLRQEKYSWYSHQIPTKVVVGKTILVDFSELSFLRNFSVIYYLRKG